MTFVLAKNVITRKNFRELRLAPKIKLGRRKEPAIMLTTIRLVDRPSDRELREGLRRNEIMLKAEMLFSQRNCNALSCRVQRGELTVAESSLTGRALA
jgi:hypothetical protein